MLAELFTRIQALFRRRKLDDDLDQELQTHIDFLTEEHLRRGLSPEEAHRAARLRVGGITSLKERHREVRGAAEAVRLRDHQRARSDSG